MSEESTAPDLVELTRRALEAGSRRDFAALLGYYGPGSVWDMSPIGMGTFEGQTAIRGFFEDWMGAYSEYRVESEEILDIGNGVIFAVIVQSGRLTGSSGEVRFRWAQVGTWTHGKVARLTNYPESDLDEARAAAERIAQERGYAMSQENVERARRLFEQIDEEAASGIRVDESGPSVHPDIEYREDPRWPGSGVYRGLEAVRGRFEEYRDIFGDVQMELGNVLDAGDSVVLVFNTRGESVATKLPFEHEWAWIWTFRDRQLTEWQACFDADDALTVVGLRK
jgi:ketosteroid isomerase-like protein